MYNLITNNFPCRLILSWSPLSHQHVQPQPPSRLPSESLDTGRDCHCVNVSVLLSDVDAPIETSFVRCSMLSALVKGLACRECSEPTLKIRAIDRRLDLVCLFETYCTTCGAVLNSMLSSDWIDEEKAGNVPFVIVRQAVAARMDMDVGHAGLVKLCRFMDMERLQRKSYWRHVKAVTAANMTVVSSLFDDAANTVCQTYTDRDASITPDAERKWLHEAEWQAEASTKTV